jgi:hypothetical protein
VRATALYFDGDVRRHGAQGMPRCLQPFQGWLTVGGSSDGGARLATGYVLPALQAEAAGRQQDNDGWFCFPKLLTRVTQGTWPKEIVAGC